MLTPNQVIEEPGLAAEAAQLNVIDGAEPDNIDVVFLGGFENAAHHLILVKTEITERETSIFSAGVHERCRPSLCH